MNKKYDLIVVGAGIVGLAHALQGVRRGLRTLVIERDAACIGASIRNFGFVTVTGQRRGTSWARARRTREIWDEVAPQAGIPIVHRGLWVPVQRPSALAVLEAFCGTEMGEGCELLTPDQAAQRHTALELKKALSVLYSPHDLRVESREALPRLASWLGSQGVEFRWSESVLGVCAGEVQTAHGTYHAERIAVCAGAELHGLFAPVWARHALQLCQLQMLRVQPQQAIRLQGSVMGELSLVRYEGYAQLPQAAALKAELQVAEAESLAHGIHLIAVQSADGSLVVGDSHHYGPVVPPFASEQVDDLILRHLREHLKVGAVRVLERWTGVYPSGPEPCIVEAPDPTVRLVMISSGTGASTAFGLAEEVFKQW